MAAATSTGPRRPSRDDFQVVGKSHRKIDGMAKATGEAVYADDIQLPGMLHARRSAAPTPRADRLHRHLARRGPAGRARRDHRPDLPIQYGVIPWTPDETALAVDKVRFIGDEVAAVAAVDEDTANAALELIDVEYEDPPRGARPRRRASPSSGTPPRSTPTNGNNVSKHVELEFGDVEAGRERADLVVKNTTSSTARPTRPSSRTAPWLAVPRGHPDPLELDPDLPLRPPRPRARARVGAPAHPRHPALPRRRLRRQVGPLQPRVLRRQARQITGPPVKMLWTREEVFYAHRGRHPMEMTTARAPPRTARSPASTPRS